MWINDANSPSRGFLTPPPTWNSRPRHSPMMPMSERKRSSPPVNKGDNFHVIHKVPAGDSPYVKAKQVQLIDKDPSKAISLFWAAINAGDRVDSALKDMAIVMKQLNRADEAIEAIKSFRHLCPYDAQGSLDNVLVELYKRSGRIEEEIEMLQRKLKNIEEGTVFCGKRTKTARSQGKKILITIEQEKSRILGNLAWAYLQLKNYTTAEELYRKALSLEPDRNKECNLAICLMHTNRIAEAKSLLQAVRASSRDKELDESCAKSLERALEMLAELEPQSVLQPIEKETDNRRNIQRTSMLPINRNLNEVFSSTVSRSREDGQNEETVMLTEQKKGFSGWHHLENQENSRHDEGKNCIPSNIRNTSLCSPQTTFVDKWKKGSCSENPCVNQDSPAGIKFSSACKNTFSSPASVGRNVEVPFIEPRRRCSWGFNDKDQRRDNWKKNSLGGSHRKLSFDQPRTYENAQAPTIQELNEQSPASTWSKDMQKSETAFPSLISGDWRRSSGAQDAISQSMSSWKSNGYAQVQNVVTKSVSQPDVNRDQKRNSQEKDGEKTTLPTEPPMDANNTGSSVTIIFGGRNQSSDATVSGNTAENKLPKNNHSRESNRFQEAIADNAQPAHYCLMGRSKKSWADMVEEEEDGTDFLGDLLQESLFSFQANDENLDSNISQPTPCPLGQIEILNKKMESSNLDGGYSALNVVSVRNLIEQRGCSPMVANERDSVSGKDLNHKRRNRLQVFRDITDSV